MPPVAASLCCHLDDPDDNRPLVAPPSGAGDLPADSVAADVEAGAEVTAPALDAEERVS